MTLQNPGEEKKERINGIPNVQEKDGTVFKNDLEKAEYLLKTKFPRRAESDSLQPYVGTYPVDNEEEPVLVSRKEISEILKKNSNRSAPGLDDINNKHLQILNKKHPELITDVINGCLK